MFWQFHFSASVHHISFLCLTSLSKSHSLLFSFLFSREKWSGIGGQQTFLLVPNRSLTPSSSFSIFSLFVSSSRASSHLVHHRQKERHKCVKKRMQSPYWLLSIAFWPLTAEKRILKVQQRWEICSWHLFYVLHIGRRQKNVDGSFTRRAPFHFIEIWFIWKVNRQVQECVRLWKTPLMTISKPLAFCRLLRLIN